MSIKQDILELITYRFDTPIQFKSHNMHVPEEYIIQHADTFDWSFFVCEQTLYSGNFINRFKDKIRMYTYNWKFHNDHGPAIINPPEHKYDAILTYGASNGYIFSKHVEHYFNFLRIS